MVRIDSPPPSVCLPWIPYSLVLSHPAWQAGCPRMYDVPVLQIYLEAIVSCCSANSLIYDIAAMTALRRKKTHETHLASTIAQINTIEQQMHSIETANLNFETLKVMQSASDAMKKIHNGMNLDKVDMTMYVTIFPCFWRHRAWTWGFFCIQETRILTSYATGRKSGNSSRLPRKSAMQSSI